MFKYFESALMRLYVTGIVCVAAAIALSETGTIAGALAFLGVAMVLTAIILKLNEDY